VSFAVSYSYLLFSMCVAYAETGLLVLMYCICSLCLVAMGQPDCSTYTYKHVLNILLVLNVEVSVF
jgi:hypothetical protein